MDFYSSSVVAVVMGMWSCCVTVNLDTAVIIEIQSGRDAVSHDVSVWWRSDMSNKTSHVICVLVNIRPQVISALLRKMTELLNLLVKQKRELWFVNECEC